MVPADAAVHPPREATTAPPVAPLPHWRALPPPRHGLTAIVVVPARNEAARIGQALEALATQRDLAGEALPHSAFEILVLVNNSDDGTAAIARLVARDHPALVCHVVEAALEAPQANVGYVRRQLMDAGLDRLRRAGGSPRAVIASTDGDSRVAPDWLAAQLAAIDAGADAVGGRIVGEPVDASLLGVRRAQRVDLAHALLRSRLESALLPDAADPWPRHHQHFGASLAVTARAYADVGGVPTVPFLEDEALVQALRRRDWAVRHCPRVRVGTSSRFDGRAEVGLAWQLRQWADRTSEYHDAMVEPAGSWIEGLGALAELRRRRTTGAAGDPMLDARLGVATGVSASLLAAGGPFGAMRETVEQLRREALVACGGLVPLSIDLPDLRAACRRLARPSRTVRA